MIPDLVVKMAAKFGYTRKMVVHPKQVINNSKVSDHHAIIPTINVADVEFGELPIRGTEGVEPDYSQTYYLHSEIRQ